MGAVRRVQPTLLRATLPRLNSKQTGLLTSNLVKWEPSVTKVTMVFDDDDYDDIEDPVLNSNTIIVAETTPICNRPRQCVARFANFKIWLQIYHPI